VSFVRFFVRFLHLYQPSLSAIILHSTKCSINRKRTVKSIKWYDALTNGNLLANTTPLQNGITYYASQTINGCESGRIPVLINIQNTTAPIK
jgi:6-phosphogluconate dehydrogenase